MKDSRITSFIHLRDLSDLNFSFKASSVILTEQKKSMTSRKTGCCTMGTSLTRRREN